MGTVPQTYPNWSSKLVFKPFATRCCPRDLNKTCDWENQQSSCAFAAAPEGALAPNQLKSPWRQLDLSGQWIRAMGMPLFTTWATTLYLDIFGMGKREKIGGTPLHCPTSLTILWHSKEHVSGADVIFQRCYAVTQHISTSYIKVWITMDPEQSLHTGKILHNTYMVKCAVITTTSIRVNRRVYIYTFFIST